MMKRAMVLSLPVLAVSMMGINDCDGGGGTTVPWEVPGTDFAAPGTFEISTENAELAAPSGCTLEYIVYAPLQRPDLPIVVLSHGFQRNMTVMEEMGRHLASYGFTVATPNLCHSVPSDNKPEQDAQDMMALATVLGAGDVVYIGHSAGGMRSAIAADMDPRTLVVHGLDLVDAGDLALDAAAGIAEPFYGTVGEPSSCNANNNGIPVYQAAPDAVAVRAVDADHCDFESPTDALCTSFCQNTSGQISDETIHNVIWGLATSFLVWQTGVDPSGSEWWTPGKAPYEWLLASGLVEHVVR